MQIFDDRLNATFHVKYAFDGIQLKVFKKQTKLKLLLVSMKEKSMPLTSFWRHLQTCIFSYAVQSICLSLM